MLALERRLWERDAAALRSSRARNREAAAGRSSIGKGMGPPLPQPPSPLPFQAHLAQCPLTRSGSSLSLAHVSTQFSKLGTPASIPSTPPSRIRHEKLLGTQAGGRSVGIAALPPLAEPESKTVSAGLTGGWGGCCWVPCGRRWPLSARPVSFICSTLLSAYGRPHSRSRCPLRSRGDGGGRRRLQRWPWE